ncbi:MAG TPA: tetratricopeptide repeat protein, partial [Thermoanaerobaculia bacterium]|nr:tetratricopeptide repeat protein [Thermoanaerobaculia bacterium]
MEHKGGIRKRLQLRLPERLRVRRRGQSPSQGTSGAIKSWLGLTWSLFGVGLFLLSGLIVTLQVRQDVTLIEEFGVPEELAKQGWTGRAVAKGLLDKLQHIQTNATTRMDRVPFSSSWSVQSPDMVVAGTSVPLSSLVRHLRDLFGVTTRQIDGEVILEGEEILLVARVNGSEGRTFSAEVGERGQARTIQHLLASAAQYVLEETQPYLLASFYSATDDRRCLPMIEVCLRNNSIHDDHWAYNLWGIVLMESSPQEAGAKFQRAIDLDPEFDLPYRNWGRLLIDQGHAAEAVDKLEKALELKPDAVSYSNLGFALLMEDRAS